MTKKLVIKMSRTEIPAMGYRNPGPTPNLRGVEGNTSRHAKSKRKS